MKLKKKAYNEVLRVIRENDAKFIIDLHCGPKKRKPPIADIITPEPELYKHLQWGGVNVRKSSRFEKPTFLPNEFISPDLTFHYVALEIYLYTNDHLREIDLAEKLIRQIYTIQKNLVSKKTQK